MQHADETWRRHYFHLMDDFVLVHTEGICNDSDGRIDTRFYFVVTKNNKKVTLAELENFYGRKNDTHKLIGFMSGAIEKFYPEEAVRYIWDWARVIWISEEGLQFFIWAIQLDPSKNEGVIMNALEQAFLEWMKGFLEPTKPNKKSNRHNKKQCHNEKRKRH